MSEDFIVSLLAAAITMGTPLLYAALGEVICERSGVINLGVEGMMLIGACTGFIAGNSFGSPWAGVAAALLAGRAFSAYPRVFNRNPARQPGCKRPCCNLVRHRAQRLPWAGLRRPACRCGIRQNCRAAFKRYSHYRQHSVQSGCAGVYKLLFGAACGRGIFTKRAAGCFCVPWAKTLRR